jgi:hypothetical protein
VTIVLYAKFKELWLLNLVSDRDHLQKLTDTWVYG